jgi:hypothetical protein
MKLHSFDFLLAMTQSHDHTIPGFGRYLQARGQALPFDDKRMIATGCKGRLEPPKDRLAVMNNLRTLAMYNGRSPDDAPAEYLSNSLMAQANTEDGNAPAESRY